jgi:glyoxylase-like metal-dependent hydrolase (beta-lactamase superfamily II)
MLIESAPLWLAATNTWVAAREKGGEAVVVDAPPDPSGVARLLASHDLAVTALLVTHGHIDHVGGAGPVARSTRAVAYIHPDDDFLTLDPDRQLRGMLGMVPDQDFAPPETYEHLKHGQVLDLCGMRFEVRHTPGHTPGHCCFLLEEEGVLFSGDQLFAGSIGRTDLPGGDFDQLVVSMRERVLDLPDDVRVLPGHGPETTIGWERRTNPFRHEWA